MPGYQPSSSSVVAGWILDFADLIYQPGFTTRLWEYTPRSNILRAGLILGDSNEIN